MSQTETRQKAQQLFISGLSLDEIAVQLDIPQSTVSKWSAADGWKEKREVEKKLASMMPKIKLKLLNEINDSKDPQATAQLVNAFAGLKKATEGIPKATKDQVPDDKPDQKDKSPEETVQTIKDVLGV